MNYLTLQSHFQKFDSKRLATEIVKNDHRYNSFDFCFNYFSSFENKNEIASSRNMESSCLQLGFYLASWGMYRGSSELLGKSLRYFIPMIREIAACDKSVWSIDVNYYEYNHVKDQLIDTYRRISSHIPNQSKLTLATKIMLGVFGNTPAFDRFFKTAMSELTKGSCGFSSFNKKSLTSIFEFYRCNKEVIDALSKKTKTNSFGYEAIGKPRKITRAKVIDIIGFQYGLQKKI